MFCVVTSQAAVFVTETQEAGWLSAETKLAITLRFPAGGSYLDIREMWGIRTTTFYDTVHVMLQALHKLPHPDCLSLNEILEMPDAQKNEHLSAISKEFACLANGLFVGCIWCIDGLCIRIQRPPESKVSNPARCYNRKGFFALSMQGVCDARRRIRSASVICPGNLHHYSSGLVISFCLFGGCSYRFHWFTGV